MTYPIHHSARPPDVPQLLHLLQTHEINYVLAGSVAAQLYDAPVQPGDLDIVPALDLANLQQLVRLLQGIEASIDGTAGHWEIQADGERKWIAVHLTTEEQAAQAAAWRPHAEDISTLDHLFQTRYGNFDVVPEVSGTYTYLMERAVALQAHGVTLWVAHMDDLLVTLTVPRRQKDQARVQALRALQHQRGRHASAS